MKPARTTERGLVVAGVNSVLELLRSGTPVERVLIGPGPRRRELLAECGRRGATPVEADRQTLDRLELPRHTRGVLITRVEPLSASFDSGIERGTVLLEINRQRVESVAEYRRIARAARPGDILTLWVYAPDLVQRQLKTIRVDDR